MKLIAALGRFPLYSIAVKSYQVRASHILPPPSALKGALAKALLYTNKKYSAATLDEISMKILDDINKKLWYATTIPLDPIVTSPVLLKRLRTLEEATGKKDPDKQTVSDAMLRQYIFTKNMALVYVFHDNTSNDELKNLETIALNIDQMGDTESIGSIVLDTIQLNEQVDKNIGENAFCDNYIPVKNNYAPEGFVFQYMQETPIYQVEKKKKKSIETKPYILPLSEFYIEKQQTTVYIPKRIPAPEYVILTNIRIRGEEKTVCVPKSM